MKKILLVVIILLAILPLTACNEDLVAVDEVTDSPINDVEDENKVVCMIESTALTIFTFQLENDVVISAEVEVTLALRDFGLDASDVDLDTDTLLDLIGITGFNGEVSIGGIGDRYLILSDKEDMFNGQSLNEVLQERELQDAFCI